MARNAIGFAANIFGKGGIFGEGGCKFNGCEDPAMHPVFIAGATPQEVAAGNAEGAFGTTRFNWIYSCPEGTDFFDVTLPNKGGSFPENCTTESLFIDAT